MRITKREILVSIIIISIMLLLGFVIHGNISDKLMLEYQKYNTALQIENDTDLFTYGMKTNVGNAFVYGDLKAVDTVTYPEIGGEYSYVEKVKERYTQHTRTVTYTDSNGKLKKYEINHDFFLKLGALIRYAKTMCSQSNADGSFGLGDASGEFVAEPITKYVIPMGTTNKTLGTVELRLGVIYSMYVENDSFKVELEEDGTLPEEIFGKIKNTSPKGFMFSEDFLDFPVKMALDSQNLNGLYRDLAEVIAAHPEKELEWLLTKEYYIVTDDMLDSLFEEFMNTQDYVYFDTETTGLNIKYDLPFLLPWGFLSPDNKTAYVYCADIDINKSVFEQTAMAITALAKDKGIPNCSKLKKSELIEKILENYNSKLIFSPTHINLHPI